MEDKKTKIKIRKGTNEDLDAIYECHIKCFDKSDLWYKSIIQQSLTNSFIIEKLDDKTVIGILLQGEITACEPSEINNFSIDICRVEAVLGIGTNPILNSSVYPNPTKGIVNVAIPSLTDYAKIRLIDLQGRQILTKETNQVYTSFGIENLQDGIYLVNIENDKGSITKKIILKRN
jgi:hypothetical protein